MIRILIVEDDENISKMLAATLSIGGYTYEQCADGVEAAARIPEGAYDLVLLDVMLPGLDGFAVLDTIRAAGCDTPVIFLTALGAVADKVKGLRGGAEDYIVKPFEAVELLARIEVVLWRAGKSEMHLSYGDIRVDIEKHTVLKGGQPVTLTPGEEVSEGKAVICDLDGSTYLMIASTVRLEMMPYVLYTAYDITDVYATREQDLSSARTTGLLCGTAISAALLMLVWIFLHPLKVSVRTIGEIADSYIFNDPWAGECIAYDKESVELAYATLYEQAIVLP